MNEKLNKQNFYQAMNDVFEPSIDQQIKWAEESVNIKTTRKVKLGNAILKGLENNDELTQINNATSTKLTKSNVKSASIVKVLADVMKSKVFILV